MIIKIAKLLTPESVPIWLNKGIYIRTWMLTLGRQSTRRRTYVMVTYVSEENNLGPDDKIRYIWGLKGPIFIL